MHWLLAACCFWVSLMIDTYIKPKPPKADRAIIGSTDKRAMRIALSMMLELMRVSIGKIMLPMMALAFPEMPLMTSLLLRATCTA